MILKIESCRECPAYSKFNLRKMDCTMMHPFASKITHPATVPPWCPLRNCEVNDHIRFDRDQIDNLLWLLETTPEGDCGGIGDGLHEMRAKLKEDI